MGYLIFFRIQSFLIILILLFFCFRAYNDVLYNVTYEDISYKHQFISALFCLHTIFIFYFFFKNLDIFESPLVLLKFSHYNGFFAVFCILTYSCFIYFGKKLFNLIFFLQFDVILFVYFCFLNFLYMKFFKIIFKYLKEKRWNRFIYHYESY